MNKHILVDRLVVALSRLLPDNKKFFAGSIEGPSFTEHINGIELPELVLPNQGDISETEVNTLDGPCNTAFKVARWIGSDAPTLLYHHGNNERPFDMRKGAKNTYPGIFLNRSAPINANIFVIRAPYHNTTLKEYQRKMKDLTAFMAMIATSVSMNEALINLLRKKGVSTICTCGMSLGGWVTNLHRAVYNSSDAYIPLMAGTFLGSLFTQSRYRHLTSSKAKGYHKQIEDKLNFQELHNQVDSNNLFPLLARYDQFIEYEVQKRSYKKYPLKVIEAGHITGALSPGQLSEHISNVLAQVKAQE